MEEKNLNKEIDDLQLRIMDLEQKWLREQNELVRLIKDHQAKQVECKNYNDNLIILSAKKMRVESEMRLSCCFCAKT